MPDGLVRYHETGAFHFVTFSCFGRKPYLRTPYGRELFERSLEKMRVRYGFVVAGYVVMPEHVHLVMNEPRVETLATALQALKLSVSVQSVQRPFWLKRYYDFNVYSPEKTSEKVRYIHLNPVRRGLVAEAVEWAWSSARHYATGERGTVEIESEITAMRRERARVETHVSEARRGAPGCGVGQTRQLGTDVDLLTAEPVSIT